MHHKVALAVLLLAVAAFPCFAQPQAANETTVVFKSDAQNNMLFYERGDSEAVRQPTPQWTKFSLLTNLLYWLATVPNLGIEYRHSATLGVLFNGGWSHWIWSGENRQHRTWFAQPELRYYLGANQSWFIGLEARAAQYNFKFNDTGYQGNDYGGGIIGGYRLVLNKCLDMDFSLGLGYTQLHYDSYFRSNGYMVRKETDIKKSVFAPTQAGVSLIWKIK
jgi:hypothetical protein